MADGIFKLVAPVMIFFAGGIYLGRILHGTSGIKPVLRELVLLFAVLAVFAAIAFLSGEKGNILKLLAKMACAVIGIALISYFAWWLPEGRPRGVLSYLGKNSMAIYLLHIPPMALAMYFLSSHGIKTLLPHAAIEISLGVIVPLLLIRFAGRRLRSLYYWHGSTSSGSRDDRQAQEIVKKPP